MDVAGVRKATTQRRAVWKVKCGRSECQTGYHAKLEAHQPRRDKIAAMAHTCTRHPFPRSRMSYTAACRRISGGMK